MKLHIKSFIGIHKEFAEKGYVPKDRNEVSWMSINSVHKGSLMNHYGLFLPTLLGQASPEQLFLWAPKTLTFQIIGSYAQTELGHGSNVRGLETEARFVRENNGSGYFLLNTPNLTSMKWWPGTLGKIATHATVYAQLIIDDKVFGLHVFMVQLRDTNGRALPGLEMGDLGTKLGDGANDTGYMRMQNVRVPREHMLAKGAIVTPDGKYYKTKAKKENPVMHYATMMGARAGMMAAAGGILAAGATIAARYSAVRVQGFQETATNNYKSAEVKVLDYQVQRYRVLKQVALSYAIALTGNWLTDKVQLLTSAGLDSKEVIDSLPEIHASAAGLKALATVLTLAGLEDLRKCAGGNGYLLNSGIAEMTQSFAWQITAEGDFVILLLQTARFLMKSLENARRGEPLAGLARALEPLKDHGFKISSLAPEKAKSPQDFKDPEFLEKLFRFRAVSAVVSCGDELNERLKRGMSQDAAWNATALNLTTTAKSHCFYFMLSQMNEQVAKGAKDDEKIGVVLRQLSALYACSEILDGQQWLGIIDAQEAVFLQHAVSELLDELRPNTIALVNAFDIPDRVLNSTIGRKDGNVYEALYQAAKESSLNKSEVLDGYEEILKPHLDLEMLQNENKTPLLEIHFDEESCELVSGDVLGPSKL
jgi:acyl-CoA oxidase